MRAGHLLTAALGLLLATPSIVWATEGGRPVCTAEGKSYDPGSVACIPGPDGGKRLARCELMGDPALGLYVRWTVVEDSCPLAHASLDTLERLLGHPVNAVRATPTLQH
jgi:hypothetical protein